jgi:predicted nucleic acid-binding protein
MRDVRAIVINTGPLLALIAADHLDVLHRLYDRVIVPREVDDEIIAGGLCGFGIEAFQTATWLAKWPQPVAPGLLLASSLDRGEAAVVQLALDQGIDSVCIDERVGRRVARLCGLKVTGSIGILVRAVLEGQEIDIAEAGSRMQRHGIYVSRSVMEEAVRLATGVTEPPPQPGSL